MSRTLPQAPDPHGIGVDISSVYENCLSGRLPDFDEIYDEYVMILLNLKTNLGVPQIDAELRRLQLDFGNEVFDVEHGFPFDAYGISRKMCVLEALLSQQLFFVMQQQMYNCPIREVW